MQCYNSKLVDSQLNWVLRYRSFNVINSRTKSPRTWPVDNSFSVQLFTLGEKRTCGFFEERTTLLLGLHFVEIDEKKELFKPVVEHRAFPCYISNFFTDFFNPEFHSKKELPIVTDSNSQLSEQYPALFKHSLILYVDCRQSFQLFSVFCTRRICLQHFINGKFPYKFFR